jgi:hypothetical protein
MSGARKAKPSEVARANGRTAMGTTFNKALVKETALFPSESRTEVVYRELSRCIDAIRYSDLTWDEAVKSVKEAGTNLGWLDRPWRWCCLRALLQEHSDAPEIFWPLFVQWWSDCESNLAHGWLQRTLASADGSARDFLEPEDKDFFDSLPERVTVYRGTQRPGRHVGISWTTDKEIAEWFARRFCLKGTPTLLSGQVRKSSIIAAFAHRKESEVICLPRHVHGRTETSVRGASMNNPRPSKWLGETIPG